MPATDPEPENYSIDDMMDRLRSRGEGGVEGEAELVTREDGTQMYRMRKRKRRSHQPKKEKEKRQRNFRVAQVVTAVALVAGTGLALLGSVLYLNSQAYQAKVAGKLRVWTGAEPQLTQFRASPVSAGAGAIELTWPEGSMLESLKVNGVRGDLRISSLFGSAWKGSEMVATNGGSLVLRRPGPGAPRTSERSGDCPFQFRYRSPKFNVLMGGSEKPAARLVGSEVTLTVLDAAATTANLQFEGGALSYEGWGSFGLKFASLQFEDGGVRVGNLRLTPGTETEGEIQINNPDDAPLGLEGGESVLPVRVQRAPLGSLLGPSFGTWLRAEVESPESGGDGFVTLNSDEGFTLSCRVPFRATALSESRIAALPLFGIIAREINEASYQTLRYDVEATGVVVRNATMSGVEDLRFESRGRLVVTGKVSADRAGVLDGVLEVGLPDGAVNEAPAAFRGVFKRRSEGYSWATIRISGPGSKPQDDLQKQLDAAATIVPPTSGGASSLEDAFRELTTPEGP